MISPRRLPLALLGLIPAAGLLSACAVDPIEPLPVCDLSVYEQARLAGDGPFMVPDTPGSLTAMPLNAVNIIDAKVTNKVLPSVVTAQRTDTGTIAVSARIQNCTDYPLQVELRAHFYDTAQSAAEPSTGWTRLHLPVRSHATYRTTSMKGDVDSYWIELREGS